MYLKVRGGFTVRRTPVKESKNYLKFGLSQNIITVCSPTQLFDVPLSDWLSLNKILGMYQ